MDSITLYNRIRRNGFYCLALYAYIPILIRFLRNSRHQINDGHGQGKSCPEKRQIQDGHHPLSRIETMAAHPSGEKRQQQIFLPADRPKLLCIPFIEKIRDSPGYLSLFGPDAIFLTASSSAFAARYSSIVTSSLFALPDFALPESLFFMLAFPCFLFVYNPVLLYSQTLTCYRMFMRMYF